MSIPLSHNLPKLLKERHYTNHPWPNSLTWIEMNCVNDSRGRDIEWRKLDYKRTTERKSFGRDLRFCFVGKNFCMFFGTDYMFILLEFFLSVWTRQTFLET